MASKSKKDKVVIPPAKGYTCTDISLENAMKFVLDVETNEWVIESTEGGFYDGAKVLHFHLRYVSDPGFCPECNGPLTIHDYKEREWRHENLGETVCYIHANVPRCQCGRCHTIRQVDVPWAEPKVTYTKRFETVAIEKMSQMSLAAVAREMKVKWRILDYIVDRRVKMYLDEMDLSWLCHIRVDETSAKKHHRYITVITDATTGKIVFICKGKNRNTLKEFVEWLEDHNGHPENITIVSSDFGDNFISGVREYLPNAENVMDPFHLINLANKKLDADRASNQVNGERLKSIRYSLLKDPKNLKQEEREALFDITHDNDTIAMSYAMKESLRRMYTLPPELARDHLHRWVEWVERSGSKAFRALAKTVKRHFEGIIRAIETGINNGYQENLNGRVQFTKRLANGYRRRDRLKRMVFFRDACRFADW